MAQRVVTLPFLPLAKRLGKQLATFDAELGAGTLVAAASSLLTRLSVEQSVQQQALMPSAGPLLVVANHPGVYDAMALFAALPRSDLRLITAERNFLRSMPNLSQRMLFVDDRETRDSVGSSSAPNRSRGLRAALGHLRRGGALLHFGAGQIEPDPAYDPSPAAITSWQQGTGRLALSTWRNGGTVLVAVVSGVHSKRVKHSALVRYAEARGVSTLAGLLQVALPDWAPVSLRVCVSEPLLSLGDNAASATLALENVARAIVARSPEAAQEP
jgi:hypothetical protein